MSVTTGTWATPDAVQVLRHDAPRDVWLAERAKGIGGSDAAAVLGLNPWTSPREVYYDKRGLLRPKAQSHPMLFGTLLEPGIAEGFEIITGIKTQKRGLLRSRKWPWMQVSVDRLTADGGGLEIKNMGWHRSEDWGTDEEPAIPPAAETQAMHCMAVTGKDFWWVMGLVNGNTPMIRKVIRRESVIEALVELERDFWHNCVLAAVPPPVDDSESCTRAMQQVYRANANEEAVVDPEILYPLLERKATADEEIKTATKALNQVKNEIRDLAGTAEILRTPGSGGVKPDPIFTYVANGQFSVKEFVASDPKLAIEYTREVTEERIDVKALEADKPEIHAQYRGRVLRVARGGKAVLAEIAKNKQRTESTTTEEKVAS
jgi:putative phage-type endonuclease